MTVDQIDQLTATMMQHNPHLGLDLARCYATELLDANDRGQWERLYPITRAALDYVPQPKEKTNDPMD